MVISGTVGVGEVCGMRVGCGDTQYKDPQKRSSPVVRLYGVLCAIAPAESDHEATWCEGPERVSFVGYESSSSCLSFNWRIFLSFA